MLEWCGLNWMIEVVDLVFSFLGFGFLDFIISNISKA